MSDCQAKTADGKPCGAPAQTGKAYCFQHDPEQEQARAEARKRGGEARAEQLNGAVVPTLTTATAVRDYLAQTIGNAAAGLVHPKTGAAIAALARVQLVAIERADKEAEAAENKKRWPSIP